MYVPVGLINTFCDLKPETIFQKVRSIVENKWKCNINIQKIVFLVCILFTLLSSPASAEISLDFSQQTNGVWDYHEDADISKRHTWTDQIYTDEKVINADLPMLVPPKDADMVFAGWNEDRTVYVAQCETIDFAITGLEPDAVYRVAFFVPQGDGGTGEDHIKIDYQNMAKNSNGTNIWYASVDISCYTGIYKDITIVITGNGEVYTHTFDLQIQNVYDWRIDERANGVLNGVYYGTGYVAQYEPKGGTFHSEQFQFTRPSTGIAISAPMEGDIYTGYRSISILPCAIALSNLYSLGEHLQFIVNYTLVETAAGQIVTQNETNVGLWSNDTLSFVDPSIILSSALNEGEYQLNVEVFVKNWIPELSQYGELTSLGTDSVNFHIEQEFDPTEIYAQYIHDDLRFNLNYGWNASWNADYTHLTLTDAPSLHFELLGMKPGVTYRLALMGKTASGEDYMFPFSWQAESKENNRGNGWVNISFQSGEYKNITLMAYSDEEFIAHTFDCTVNLLPENEREGDGIVFGIYNDCDYFTWLSEFPGEPPRPESGYTICMSENSIFSGYTGNALQVPIVFGSEYNGLSTIEFSLTEEYTGKVIKEATFNIDISENAYWNLGLIISENFSPGAYILHASSNGHETDIRIILEKEPSPGELYAEYMSKLSAMPSYSEQGVIVYKGEAYSIIPEINTYLDTMSSFDTDMFNQFLRYRYIPTQKMLSSFALISPNVAEREATIDQEDLLFTANSLLRDFYHFQLKDIKHYSEAKVLDINKMNTFFGDIWKELKGLDFATGMATSNDGTVFTWMPVYYEDEQGGFTNDELYLFVYILHQGADAAYLDATGFFNPEFYNEHHTTQLLITDQEVVASMLNKLNSINGALSTNEEMIRYSTLRLGSEGEQVRRLQKRLQKLGYLTTSVDAVFSQPVQEAVMAWQKDMGLQETGVVTVDVQQLLHDSTTYRQMLMTWLSDHQ